MFSANNYISTFKQVPSRWIFEHYLALGENLIGQTLRFHSPLGESGSRPAFRLTYSDKKQDYAFRCHTTGQYGDGLDLMRLLWNCTHAEAARRIERDYMQYRNGANTADLESLQPITAMVKPLRWQVNAYTERGWDADDAVFWSSFNISSDLLVRFNIRPLLSFQMYQEVIDPQGVITYRTFIIESLMTYGYFTNEGVLFKIYQPMRREQKFTKVSEYVQGYDQLRGGDYLAVLSGMKDMLAFQSLNLGIDTLAPDSENTPLPDWVIREVFPRYKYKVFMFDNDTTGIQRMQQAEALYGVPYLLETSSKDIAESVKTLGALTFRPKLITQLQQIYHPRTGVVYQ